MLIMKSRMSSKLIYSILGIAGNFQFFFCLMYIWRSAYPSLSIIYQAVYWHLSHNIPIAHNEIKYSDMVSDFVTSNRTTSTRIKQYRSSWVAIFIKFVRWNWEWEQVSYACFLLLVRGRWDYQTRARRIYCETRTPLQSLVPLIAPHAQRRVVLPRQLPLPRHLFG